MFMCTSAPAGLISLFYYSWFDYYQYRRAFLVETCFLITCTRVK